MSSINMEFTSEITQGRSDFNLPDHPPKVELFSIYQGRNISIYQAWILIYRPPKVETFQFTEARISIYRSPKVETFQFTEARISIYLG